MLQISIGYQNTPLYKDIKIELPEHGIISVLGHNGCGKSTFYKTLLGIIAPVSGEIPTQISGRIALVSDYIHIPEEVSVRDVFDLLGPDKINYAKEKYNKFHQIISSYETQSIETLSSGQRRMVEIYAVLASGKTVVILDEASNSLDYDNQRLLISQVKELSEDILFFHTTHKLEEAAYLKGEIYGLFKDDGEMRKFQKEYSLENIREFLGYQWAE